jgi:hypothetical protein
VRDDDPMRPRASVARGIGVARAFSLALVLGVTWSVVLAGCSAGDDDVDRADDEGPTTTTASDPGDATVDAEPSGSGPSNTGTSNTGTSRNTVTSNTGPTGTPESLASVPEVGVPGLDSDEIVCRAWSRFGGSFQVLAVAASFGAGDPSAVAALEVIASPTVTTAYDDLVTNWPDELVDEAEIVADDYLGPFARRSDRALAALDAAGADASTKEAIVAAWETALAGRDPNEPEIVVALPGDVQAVVDTAAAELVGQVVPIPSDPSLVTDVDVPLTEQYLIDTCPDRGTLGGVDI